MMSKMGKVAVGTAILLGATLMFCSVHAIPTIGVSEDAGKSILTNMPGIVSTDVVLDTAQEEAKEIKTVPAGLEETLPMLLDKSVNWIGAQIYNENDINVTTLGSMQAIPIAACECEKYDEVWNTNPYDAIFLLTDENLSKAMNNLYGTQFSVEEYVQSGQEDLGVSVVDNQIQYQYGEWGEIGPKMDVMSIHNVDGVYVVKAEVYMYDSVELCDDSVRVPAVFYVTENCDSSYGYVISDMFVQWNF